MRWIKASERHPPNWFTAKLRNIGSGHLCGPYPVKAVYKEAVEFDTHGYSSFTYINNIEWLDESDQPAPSIPSREQMIDKIQECISSDIYYCTRVWTAWNIGTMTEDDFKNVNNDTLLAEEIADNLLPLFNTIP